MKTNGVVYQLHSEIYSEHFVLQKFKRKSKAAEVSCPQRTKVEAHVDKFKPWET